MKPEALFMDSGAFSLYFREVLGKKLTMAFYDTPEFWSYVDDYASFIKRFSSVVTYYANVDVITEPESSYRVLKYIEDKHDLKPVPVVHCGTDVKWIERYIKEDYQMIGLGGFVGKSRQMSFDWCHKAFDVICDSAGMPSVKTHGFAMASFRSMIAFPWFSVDSSTWVKSGGFGAIIIPASRGDSFSYKRAPVRVFVSSASSSALDEEEFQFGRKVVSKDALHYDRLTVNEQQFVTKWCDHIGTTIEEVRTSRAARLRANVCYFERVTASLPEYPWPYKRPKVRKGLIS